MRYWLMVLFCAGFAVSAAAEEADISSALDNAARSARGQSVLFRRQAPSEEPQGSGPRVSEAQPAPAEVQKRPTPKPIDLFGHELKIFAEVNGEIITSRDMQDRVNAFVATTQIPVTEQTKDMVLEKVLQAAVDEKLKIQEAEKNGIVINAADLNEGMANFAKGNNTSLAAFRQMLKANGVNEDVFRAQMKAEMAWSRLVMQRARRDVKISESEVKAAVEMIEQDKNKQKYLVSEIVISKAKAKHIQDLVDNLRQDPRFELYAMQFSESPSARGGGNLGWVSQDQLAEPLAEAVSQMKVGSVSQPISVGTDYYILKLEKIYRPGVDPLPSTDEDEVREMLRSKKIEEMANKYMRDLRNRAIIERRM